MPLNAAVEPEIQRVIEQSFDKNCLDIVQRGLEDIQASNRDIILRGLNALTNALERHLNRFPKLRSIFQRYLDDANNATLSQEALLYVQQLQQIVRTRMKTLVAASQTDIIQAAERMIKTSDKELTPSSASAIAHLMKIISKREERVGLLQDLARKLLAIESSHNYISDMIAFTALGQSKVAPEEANQLASRFVERAGRAERVIFVPRSIACALESLANLQVGELAVPFLVNKLLSLGSEAIVRDLVQTLAAVSRFAAKAETITLAERVAAAISERKKEATEIDISSSVLSLGKLNAARNARSVANNLAEELLTRNEKQTRSISNTMFGLAQLQGNAETVTRLAENLVPLLPQCNMQDIAQALIALQTFEIGERLIPIFIREMMSQQRLPDYDDKIIALRALATIGDPEHQAGMIFNDLYINLFDLSSEHLRFLIVASIRLWPEDPRIPTIVQCFSENKNATPEAISNVLRSLKAPISEETATLLVPAFMRKIDQADATSLCHVLQALGKFKFGREEAVRMAVALDLCSASASTEDLANAAWGLAALGVGHGHVANLVRVVVRTIGQVRPHTASTMLWAMGKCRVAAELTPLIVPRTLKASQQNSTPRMHANALWALGQLLSDHQHAVPLAQRFLSVISSASAAEVSNSMWALARLEQGDDLVRAMGRALLKNQELNELDIAYALYALCIADAPLDEAMPFFHAAERLTLSTFRAARTLLHAGLHFDYQSQDCKQRFYQWSKKDVCYDNPNVISRQERELSALVSSVVHDCCPPDTRVMTHQFFWGLKCNVLVVFDSGRIVGVECDGPSPHFARNRAFHTEVFTKIGGCKVIRVLEKDIPNAKETIRKQLAEKE